MVEIIVPNSQRIDHVDKRRDYADAGIPHYWIIDLDEPVSITFRAETPFPVEINLDQLRS